MCAAPPVPKSRPGQDGAARLQFRSSWPERGSCWDAAGSDLGSPESRTMAVGFAGLG